jgi:uncharacterized protein (DUF58 family)
MLIFFGLCVWFGMVIVVIIDILRSRDLSGVAKALWFVVVFAIPLVGLVVYLVMRGRGMSDRAPDRVPQYQRNIVTEGADGKATASATTTAAS